MNLSLDTFIEANGEISDESIGRTELSIGDGAFVKLSELEVSLQEGDDNEVTVDAKSRDIEVDAPDHVGGLEEQELRVFLDPESQAGVFHLIARRASDSAKVVTEPTMIRMIAM